MNWRLGRALPGHYCTSVQRMGWAGLKNGELLALAQEQFDVFLTGDRNWSFQQDVTQFQIAIVILHAASTQLHHMLPLMPKVLSVLPTLRPGQLTNLWP